MQVSQRAPRQYPINASIYNVTDSMPNDDDCIVYTEEILQGTESLALRQEDMIDICTVIY